MKPSLNPNKFFKINEEKEEEEEEEDEEDEEGEEEEEKAEEQEGKGSQSHHTSPHLPIVRSCGKYW